MVERTSLRLHLSLSVRCRLSHIKRRNDVLEVALSMSPAAVREMDLTPSSVTVVVMKHFFLANDVNNYHGGTTSCQPRSISDSNVGTGGYDLRLIRDVVDSQQSVY